MVSVVSAGCMMLDFHKIQRTLLWFSQLKVSRPRPIFRQIFAWRSASARKLLVSKAKEVSVESCGKLSNRVEHYFAGRTTTLWCWTFPKINAKKSFIWKVKGKEEGIGQHEREMNLWQKQKKKKSQSPHPGIEPGTLGIHGWCLTT